MAQVVNKEDVWNALRAVIDPEIGLDIVTLGLVYDVTIEADQTSEAEALDSSRPGGASVRVVHTLTTPGCPMERVITDGIRNAIGALPGVSTISTKIVWDPMWHTGMISPDAW
jgi:metal-sulfur cluster biosynthetic enzyme